MKKTMMLMTSMLLIAGVIFAAEPVTNTAKAAEVKATVAATAAPTAVPTIAPAAVTSTPAAIEGMTPPAPGGLEGAYEEANEPVPGPEVTPEALTPNHRKDRHFTVEMTLYTPSALGTRLGYFINENWKVIGEFSTVSSLLANSAGEKNLSWAVGGNYSPADDDLSPFFGASFSSIDIAYDSKDGADVIKNYKTFLGAVLNAGLTYVSESPLFLSLEFDLYAGRFTRKQVNDTTHAVPTDDTKWTLSVMLGGGIGVIF